MDSYPIFRFANIIDSMIMGYVLAAVEGWPDIMGNYVSLFFIKIYQLSNYSEQIQPIKWTVLCHEPTNFCIFLHEFIRRCAFLKFHRSN